ncbi:YfcC family protein [Brevibacillus sp. HD3.3A]|uniref:YfcC family protein n=1 Tax=Brevibacillus sp. HD3.3A TaxID=2738979 RepID=UPI00156B3F33|nr:AbgT family transporter [Brevibacillus sp. HD3.3A]UED67970.1 AbgT family transporter [Brevibacillus sp. HD3.3A]
MARDKERTRGRAVLKQKALSRLTEINVFVLLLGILAVCVLFTYLIPAGEYARIDVNGRSVVQADSFQYTASSPIGFMGFLNSIHTGMVDSASIMFFVLIIGGSYGILSATGAMEAFIYSLTKKLGNKEKWLIPSMMLFFAAGGSLIGMFEETLPYIAILVPLCVALGFDAMTGAAIVLVGASVGFTSAIMNPFTIGIAQGIAELPPFSGIGFRIGVFVVMYVVAVIFVYRHAMKVKKNPELGIYGSYNRESVRDMFGGNVVFEQRHKLILACFLLNLVTIAVGVIEFGWYITEIAGLFILLGVIVGLIGRLSANEMVDAFLKGASSLLAGAMIIGVARAIVVVLNDGQIMDTILYYSAAVIQDLPPSLTAVGMLAFQTILSFIIPSGSGMAALTMPIMTPLSELVGITRQTAVLAFQFGDGISNIVIPGIAVAGVGMAGISYLSWIRWLFPLLLMQYGIAVVAVILAHAIGYGPF